MKNWLAYARNFQLLVFSEFKGVVSALITLVSVFNDQHSLPVVFVKFVYIIILWNWLDIFVLYIVSMAESIDVIGDGFDIDDETTFLFTSESVGEGHPGTDMIVGVRNGCDYRSI